MDSLLPPIAGGSPQPRVLSEWLALSADPPAIRRALDESRARASSSEQHAVWIHLCDDSHWTDQLTVLEARLHEGSPSTRLERYPLLGVPFAVKDNIDIAGAPTTAACPAFAHTARQSATVVQRLIDAGGLWLGKTNLDQFATGLVGTRSPYGRPASVADATRISGGSSSGSAIAVARGVVPFALGTDTAGSGRVPAGFNGLVGLKPTPGRVSTAGVVPACRTLDCVSVFAHSVADAEHVLSVIEGADADDAYSHFVAGPSVLPGRARLGVPARARISEPAGYAAAWQAALDRARSAGHTVVEIDFGLLHEVAALLYDGPWLAERHAACRTVFDTQPEAMDTTVRRVVQGALGRSATEAFEGGYRLRELQARLASLWDSVDALMVPTAPTHPTFAEVDADPIGVNSSLGTYTNFVNLLGWCALAVPARPTAAGLPFGVTFIAPASFDAALAGLGRAWTGETAPQPPLRRAQSAPWLPLAVVGAHLSGLPLNGQLIERGAVLMESTTTAAQYRLFALPGSQPPKPGLLRVREGGSAIAVEVWAVPQDRVGSLLALIPPPLGLGSVQLADGRFVHGFLCEQHALAGAADITAFGGWRAFLASRTAAA